MKRLLAIFAHPDDEAFGPGGTIACYADRGVEIHVVCATRGEAGDLDPTSLKLRGASKNEQEIKIHYVREKELLKSAEILGVKKVEFLDFIDGTLCNANYHRLAAKIKQKIENFDPHIVLTFDRLGVSGHLDHVAVSMTTTYAFLHSDKGNKLYYYCWPKKWYEERMKRYFIYFPEGYDDEDITTRIDISTAWDKKRTAMMAHESQRSDAEKILRGMEKRAKVEHFILQYHRGKEVKFPEIDLFDGI